jgi:TDG/mug DNA glycosylase family protein
VPEPITGFPPIARADAKILVLGSMPSEESLRLGQYYAHPRNAFWPIMMSLFDQAGQLSYKQRQRVLVENSVALWDSLRRCVRTGSLDSAIVGNTIEPNDFNAFFQLHSRIQVVFFNGKKSMQVYEKHVLPGLSEPARILPRKILPSTSPAMASLTRQQKLSAWAEMLDYLPRRRRGD